MSLIPDASWWRWACSCEKIFNLRLVCHFRRVKFLELPRSSNKLPASLGDWVCFVGLTHSSILISPIIWPCPHLTFFIRPLLCTHKASPRKGATNWCHPAGTLSEHRSGPCKYLQVVHLLMLKGKPCDHLINLEKEVVGGDRKIV